MNYIVFDLEWNMGYQPHVFLYHNTRITLRGEIIQIGAVRIDAQGHVLDTFHANLKPHIFRRLHHQITKVTGLTQQTLNAGIPMREGLSRFTAWCGADVALLTWGPDDLGVLKQNLFLNDLPVLDWPLAYYDLQRIYTTQHPRGEGEGMTLESVTERLGIPQDGTFHDALSDARYTAAICEHLDLARGTAAYEDVGELLRCALMPPAPAPQPDSLRDSVIGAAPGTKTAAAANPPESAAALCACAAGFVRFGPTENRDAWDSDTMQPPALCPQCGALLVPDSDGVFIKKGNHGRSMLYTCPVHGSVLVQWKRMQQDGLHWHFARIAQAASPEATAQWKKKKATYLAALRRRQVAQAAAEKQTAQAE